MSHAIADFLRAHPLFQTSMQFWRVESFTFPEPWTRVERQLQRIPSHVVQTGTHSIWTNDSSFGTLYENVPLDVLTRRANTSCRLHDSIATGFKLDVLLRRDGAPRSAFIWRMWEASSAYSIPLEFGGNAAYLECANSQALGALTALLTLANAFNVRPQPQDGAAGGAR